jgi:hypothetical protein
MLTLPPNLGALTLQSSCCNVPVDALHEVAILSQQRERHLEPGAWCHDTMIENIRRLYAANQMLLTSECFESERIKQEAIRNELSDVTNPDVYFSRRYEHTWGVAPEQLFLARCNHRCDDGRAIASQPAQQLRLPEGP